MSIQRILRRPDVENATGLSRSTIYAMMADGEFPRPIQLEKAPSGGVSMTSKDGWRRGRLPMRRRVRRMGRDRKNEKHGEHFAKLLRSTIATEAWRALRPVAQALYPWLVLKWNGPQFNNNGKIRLSVRQAAEMLGVSRNTAALGFHDLQAKGFICVTRQAQLGVGGEASAPMYELTELAMPGADKKHGRKLFRDWKPGHDFHVQKAVAHNPTGANGKTKPCHRNSDGAVIELMTCGRATS